MLASAHDEIEASARQQQRSAAREISAARQARTRSEDTIAPLSIIAPDQQAVTVPFWPADLERPSPSDAIRDNPAAASDPLTATDAPAERASASRPVTPGDLARLRSMREHLKAIDNAHGGGVALPMATWYLEREVPAIFNGQHSEVANRSLIDLVALFQLDFGWMAYDAYQQPLATANFTRALRLARASGNRLLGGRVLAAMSHQAIELGQLRQAIDYAQAARTATRHNATPRTVAMLAAMEACAHAAADDGASCHQALDDAAKAVGLIVVGQSEPPIMPRERRPEPRQDGGTLRQPPQSERASLRYSRWRPSSHACSMAIT